MLIAFIYDAFRIKRRAVKTRGISIYFEDFLYWIIVTLVMFGVVYRINDGEIRGYIFLGTLLGLILYILLLSRIVINLFMAIIRVIIRVIRVLWYIVSFPLKIIFRILRIPCRALFIKLHVFYRSGRKISKNRLSLLRKRMKLFNNARKKI